MRSLKIIRVQGGKRETVEDRITEEISLRLLAEHRRIAELMCSPGDLEDMVRGFFFTNGFIQKADQIRRIVINRATWSAFIELDPEIDAGSFRLSGVIGSACGSTLPVDEDSAAAGVGQEERGEVRPSEVRPSEAGLRVSAQYIGALMEAFRAQSEHHRQTGGVHAAALADQKDILVFREDIGRHNAVDKVIGACLLLGNNFTDKLLLTSGRLSSEILHKAVRCSLPIVVSRSAPTDRSVALARERNITLIGFARGQRMNVYSGAERVVVEPL
ncbi:MAG: formate dehydrogenase accessory sulfurtransferase FdhD [Spirochaetaceae bacterium]|nr:MAG: formate dehydrogenase accessory sulfurtransferase FdhD [Spirochaetaceae bacterium]